MKLLILGSLLAVATLVAAPVEAQVFGTGGYTVIDKTTALGTLAAPNTFNYGNSFGGSSPAAVVGSTGSFYDDITFTVAASTADSITSTINLGSLIGINNLSARIFSGSGPYTGTAGSVMDLGWGTSVSYAPGVTGTTVVIAPLTLNAGTYTLEVAGTVASGGVGSYAGVLNISAIPEAGTLGLMCAGLVLVGVIVARRRPGMAAGQSDAVAAA
jgi:hypothetical protein